MLAGHRVPKKKNHRQRRERKKHRHENLKTVEKLVGTESLEIGGQGDMSSCIPEGNTSGNEEASNWLVR